MNKHTKNLPLQSRKSGLKEAKAGPGLSRRGFLAASLGGALMMAPGAALAGMAAKATLQSAHFSPNVWIEMDADGKTLINIARAEMGQHVGTALARIVADELEVAWDDVEVSHVDSHPKWGYMVTGGSWSVFQSFVPLSQAGAAGRKVLLDAGAKMLGASPADCRARASRIIYGDRSVSYGDIVKAGAIERTITAEEMAALPLKPVSERRLIGMEAKALDIPAKSTGEAIYGLDQTIDGMVYARPLLPPTRYGSRILSIEDAAARSVPGYIRTLQLDADKTGMMPAMALVIADSTSAAFMAGDLIEIDFAPGETADVDEDSLMARADTLIADPASGSLWVDDGNLDEDMAGADTRLELRYTTSTMLHFQLEPVNAIARFAGGKLDLWGGNQWQSLAIPMIAQSLELAEADITLHQSFLGGGFGRRLVGDYFLPAAHAARAMGRPVKLVYTRADDSVMDCVRSPSVQKVRLGLKDGQISAMQHDAAAAWPTAANAPGFLFPGVEGGKPADPFAISGADHWYSMAAHKVRAVQNDLAQKSFLPGWWRAVGPGWTTFAVESAVDEAAHALGVDPVAFRLSMLDGQGKNAGKAPESVGGARRLRAVLERAVEKAGWGRTLEPGRALGVAVGAGQERTMPTWVAVVADVSVDAASGGVTLHKITSVIDCGTVVHPDGALAQAESATLWGVSHALYEGTRFAGGQVEDTNLDTYTPLRMSQVPELDIEFMENGYAPTGLGEPPFSPVAPAIANAVFAAAGARVRSLPIRPEGVKAARV